MIEQCIKCKGLCVCRAKALLQPPTPPIPPKTRMVMDDDSLVRRKRARRKHLLKIIRRARGSL